MRSVAVVLVLSTGCVKADLVECSDGRSCPQGTTCDVEHATCIDPRGVSIPEGAIDFASVGCGTSAELVVPMRNFGLSPIDFEARSTVNGVTPNPASGSIAAGGSLDLHVTADPGPQSIPGVTVEGSLVISTGFELLERPVRMTTVGALATTDLHAIDFGEIGQGATKEVMFGVRNSGNAGMDVALGGLTAPFSIVGASSAHVDPGAGQAFRVLFSPPAVASFGASAGLQFTGSLCQPPPASIPVSGISSGDSLLVDHTLLDFGTSACGSLGKALNLGLTNNLLTQQDVSLVVGDPAFGAAANASVPPTGTTLVPVSQQGTPLTGPVGPQTTTLTISGTMTPTKIVTLSHQIMAPVLVPATDATSVDFGVVPRNSISSMTVGISNIGNAVASVSVTPGNYQLGSIRVYASPSAFQIAPGVSAQVTFTLISGDDDVGFADLMFTLEAPGQCSEVPALYVAAQVSGG